MKCVRSVKLNVCVSGEAINSFSPSRGLRQGDPLSPYLFILVAEVLSLMISKSQIATCLSGIKLSQSCPVLTHSFFADDSLLYMKASNGECSYLSKLLKGYCSASGQVINLDKSSIFFSSNTPMEVRAMVCNTLGVSASEDPGKYLGIPSIWGKTKCQALAYVRERVTSKLQSWGTSSLSYAGREVMIKAVIQAIPIFPMNCFKFPLKSCKEIHSLIANFWWDGNAFGNRTHWKAWDILTEGKDSGGMGFKDLITMNNSLLAKTAWRLLTRPNDLWVKVMKSVYFPKGEFLAATKGHRASWCWSSLLDGRATLKKDLRWDVGSGTAIRIWGEPWISGEYLPAQPDESDNPYVESGRVCDLIVDGRWSLGPISQLLTEEEKNAISLIPIPTNGLEDKLIWSYAKNGEYTVKLGYMAEKNRLKAGTCRAGPSIVVSASNWKSVWKLKIIPRVQHFIWRVLNASIATNYALFRRRRAESSLCPICEQTEETTEHLFFHCAWTRCVWFGCPLGGRVDFAKITNFRSWWIQILGMTSFSSYDLSLISWLLWLIWKQRNEKVFNSIEPNPLVVIELANKNVADFMDATDVRQFDVVLADNTCFRNHCWVPPGNDSVKINCDGAFKEDGGGAAIGLVCRNHFGTFKWGFVSKVKSISAFMTEALALKRALLIAMDIGLDKAIFESDCYCLIKCVNAKSPSLYDWRCRGIIHDIVSLLSSKVGFSISFTPREGNCVADHLAAIAYKEVCPAGWVSQPTPSLLRFLTLDARKAASVRNAVSRLGSVRGDDSYSYI
ncbi:hypothetical protein QN277_008388 [Acacia crassicarpa]|nr:hypothetical protein QN277_008388 [Acacia crassicarpa]